MALKPRSLANGNVTYESYASVAVGTSLELPTAGNGYTREPYTVISCEHDGIRMYVIIAQPPGAKPGALAVAGRKFRYMGASYTISVCDCCGKRDLKVTHAIAMHDTGEIFHYGSTCVTKNTGMSIPELERSVTEELRKRATAAVYEWRGTPEYRALKAQLAADHGYDALAPEDAAITRERADSVRRELAEKHGIQIETLRYPDRA
ncbi:hypothetical protein [Paraburkholderia sp. GAS32]|uniref:hypothetical protein n=1 Tax=Paraburkholderia sp. GAS32 TaxID=3035129 RepID=UPI003D22873C